MMMLWIYRNMLNLFKSSSFFSITLTLCRFHILLMTADMITSSLRRKRINNMQISRGFNIAETNILLTFSLKILDFFEHFSFILWRWAFLIYYVFSPRRCSFSSSSSVLKNVLFWGEIKSRLMWNFNKALNFYT